MKTIIPIGRVNAVGPRNQVRVNRLAQRLENRVPEVPSHFYGLALCHIVLTNETIVHSFLAPANTSERTIRKLQRSFRIHIA